MPCKKFPDYFWPFSSCLAQRKKTGYGYRPMDQLTDQLTDQPTDKASYRV